MNIPGLITTVKGLPDFANSRNVIYSSNAVQMAKDVPVDNLKTYENTMNPNIFVNAIKLDNSLHLNVRIPQH